MTRNIKRALTIEGNMDSIAYCYGIYKDKCCITKENCATLYCIKIPIFSVFLIVLHVTMQLLSYASEQEFAMACLYFNIYYIIFVLTFIIYVYTFTFFLLFCLLTDL